MTQTGVSVKRPMRKSAASASAKAVADATASLRTARSAYSERPQGEHAAKSKHKPAQSQVNARIDAKLKAEGDAALASAGFTPTQAVRMLWTLAVRCQGEPEKLRAALDPDSAEPSEDERAAAKKEISKRKADFEKRENKFVKNMMANFDKDDDGKLSEPEFKEFIVYQRTVSAEARKDMPQRFGKDAGPKIPVEFFKALGVEAKSLNFKERHLVFGNFKKIYAKGLKQFDADSNGKLDKEELKSMMDSESFKADMAKLQSQLQKGKGGK